jgi:hypothetical protein
LNQRLFGKNMKIRLYIRQQLSGNFRMAVERTHCRAPIDHTNDARAATSAAQLPMAQPRARVAPLRNVGVYPGLVVHLVRDEGVAGLAKQNKLPPDRFPERNKKIPARNPNPEEKGTLVFRNRWRGWATMRTRQTHQIFKLALTRAIGQPRDLFLEWISRGVAACAALASATTFCLGGRPARLDFGGSRGCAGSVSGAIFTGSSSLISSAGNLDWNRLAPSRAGGERLNSTSIGVAMAPLASAMEIVEPADKCYKPEDRGFREGALRAAALTAVGVTSNRAGNQRAHRCRQPGPINKAVQSKLM